MQPQGLEVSLFLIVANIIIVIAAVFFFLIIRIQQKRKRLYEKQLLEKEFKTREDAFLQISRDLHDEIGSSLSGINLFAQMAGKQLTLNNNNEAIINIEKTIDYSAQVIEKISDMAWLLKPSHESIETMIKRLKAFGTATAETKKTEIHFDVDHKNMAKEISLQQRKVIYLISKEAINNAIKYSGCNTIHYKINIEEGITELSIKDDGKGFNTAENKKGNGLSNMKARANEIGASFTCLSFIGNGTEITLRF